MAEAKEKKKEASEDPKAGGTELSTVKSEATDLVAADDDFFQEGGGGLSDFQQSDFLIPYVRIIQALSKELQRNHAKFIPNAQQGMFVNSATRKLYEGEKEGFIAVPVGFGHRYMAWRPNNAGPAYDMGDDASKFNSIQPDEEGKRFDGEGNELTDALQYFVILVDPKTFEWEVAVLNFSGVQAKKGRGWATTINNRMERFPAGHPKAGQLFRPNMWFFSYKITTVPESNDKGSWYGFSIEEGPKVMDLTNGREIYRAASELRKRIDANEVKAAIDREDDAEPGEEKAF
jgi:hypothetical protein